MSSNLLAITTFLEGHAGASTSANTNAAGYWKRIAAASETVAGVATSANETIAGYMLRTAVALESIAGTSGAEENANEAGYAKRIVDALEVQSGSVEIGSYLHRMMLGAQNAIFGSGETHGPELVVNGGFDADTDWFKSRAPFGALPTISGGKAHFTAGTAGNQQRIRQTFTEQPPGDYEISLDIETSGVVDVSVELHNQGVLDVGSSGQFLEAGAGKTLVISPGGQFDQLVIYTPADLDIDNVSLKLVL